MQTKNQSWLRNNPQGDVDSILTFIHGFEETARAQASADESAPTITLRSAARNHEENLRFLMMLTSPAGRTQLTEGLGLAFFEGAVADINGARSAKNGSAKGLVTAKIPLTYRDEDDVERVADVELTAPSAQMAMNAFDVMVTRASLQTTAIALCRQSR